MGADAEAIVGILVAHAPASGVATRQASARGIAEQAGARMQERTGRRGHGHGTETGRLQDDAPGRSRPLGGRLAGFQGAP